MYSLTQDGTTGNTGAKFKRGDTVSPKLVSGSKIKYIVLIGGYLVIIYFMIPSPKRHIRWLLSVGLLLAGAVMLSGNPIVQSGYPLFSSGQGINSEAHSGCKFCAEDIDLPAGAQGDDQGIPYRLLLGEADKKDSQSGMDTLVFIKQAHKHSVTPAAGFSLDAPFPVKFLTLLGAEYITKLNRPLSFSHPFTFPPPTGGTAINAP